MRYKFNTLKRNNDFSRAYARGQSFVHPLLVVYVNKNRTGSMRVGITTSKKVGNAVCRNRAKRVIRAAMREVLPQNAIARDIVFVARTQTAKVKAPLIIKAMQKLLQKAGVISPQKEEHEKNN